MSDLKRLEVKYVRDGAKAAYTKHKECFICGSEEELQMHHYYTMTPLWERWKKRNKIVIKFADEVMRIRDTFINDHHDEIYSEVVTLCKFHHMERLHKIYGKVPLLSTAKKQKNWCVKQRAKEYTK